MSHDQESCGEPDPDQSNIETTTVAMPDSIDLSVVSDASSNISKLTFEGTTSQPHNKIIGDSWL